MICRKHETTVEISAGQKYVTEVEHGGLAE